LEGIKSSVEILKDSLFKFEFELKPWRSKKDDKINESDLAEFIWSYDFNPHPLMKINEKQISINSIKKRDHELTPEHLNTLLIGDKFDYLDKENRNKFLLNSDLNNIGTIKGKFFVFNLSKDIFNLFFGGQTTAVKNYIKENYGVKIFRDNMRIYNYGEQIDDWLDLDYTKIQRAGDHFARKITIGAIELNLIESENGLIEKTNREGFNENYYYKKLQIIVKQIFQKFENISSLDKEKVEEFLEKIKPIKKVGLSETIRELSEKIKDKNLENELTPLIKRVEKDYNEMRDVMVNSGMTGLNLGVVFHEVDREMKFINSDLNNSNVDIDNVRGRVKNLIQILENFSPILRQNKNINISAAKLVERITQNNTNRLSYHKIILSCPILSKENKDFQIHGPGNLIMGALANLIDNSIYWVSVKRDSQNSEYKSALYIGTDVDSFDGPAIIIADNGTGFGLEPEELVQPFKTTKPNGMGLGLYFANLVMEMIGGKLIFPDNEDLDIPKVYNGACIALVFPKTNKNV
ncbi:MAG: sensor histidine kinase, partial [Bacteroidetes bacterium]|nr:sensor histidine kinase [Bacteroidota bacterium]